MFYFILLAIIVAALFLYSLRTDKGEHTKYARKDGQAVPPHQNETQNTTSKIGRASCRERV